MNANCLNFFQFNFINRHFQFLISILSFKHSINKTSISVFLFFLSQITSVERSVMSHWRGLSDPPLLGADASARLCSVGSTPNIAISRKKRAPSDCERSPPTLTSPRKIAALSLDEPHALNHVSSLFAFLRSRSRSPLLRAQPASCGLLGNFFFFFFFFFPSFFFSSGCQKLGVRSLCGASLWSHRFANVSRIVFQPFGAAERGAEHCAHFFLRNFLPLLNAFFFFFFFFST
jgi:hypothetical protein